MVSVIVPLYYCSPTLYLPISRCFEAIERLKGDYELIVVNDGSPLDPPYFWPHTIDLVQNGGFTATVNVGLEAASGDVLLVLNDDVELTQECFDRFVHLTGLKIASPMDTASSDDDRFGACWAMTREVYEKLGPLSERYRNFFSDSDYYDRAKKAGAELIKWRDITLSHPESSTYKLLDKETLLNEDAKRYHNK